MRYRIRRLLSTSLGAYDEHFRIQDETGVDRFSVDNKMCAYWPALSLRDANGITLLSIQRHGYAPQAEHRIFRDDHEVATVQQHWVDGHQRFTAIIGGAASIEIVGDWDGQAFDFMRGDQRIARDEGPWFSMNAPHDITIAPDQDDALILACATAVWWVNEPAR